MLDAVIECETERLALFVTLSEMVVVGLTVADAENVAVREKTDHVAVLENRDRVIERDTVIVVEAKKQPGTW